MTVNWSEAELQERLEKNPYLKVNEKHSQPADRWTIHEIELLKKCYAQKMSLSEIEIVLGKSKGSIRNKADKLNISQSNKWTIEEINFLKENYAETNLKELSQRLNRLESNICRKAKYLGLKKNGQPSAIRSEAAKKEQEQRKQRPGYDEIKKKIGEATKKRIQENGHPKGFKGKKRTPEFLEKQSKRFKEMWADPNSIVNTPEFRKKRADNSAQYTSNRCRIAATGMYSKALSGFREDLGFYVRSRWEANYARYLKYLQQKGVIYRFEYEPDTFKFTGIERGQRSYTPDFKVWTNETNHEYHEVKGYMDQKSRVKLDRMAKFYPEVKIILVDKPVYQDIRKKISTMIEYWEDE